MSESHIDWTTASLSQIRGLVSERNELSRENKRLQAECAAMRETLEIVNDCLFGNTYDDPHLQEAYSTVHDALESPTDAQWLERSRAMERVVEAGSTWMRRRHAMSHEFGPNMDDLKELKKECVELERVFTRALEELEAITHADTPDS